MECGGMTTPLLLMAAIILALAARGMAEPPGMGW